MGRALVNTRPARQQLADDTEAEHHTHQYEKQAQGAEWLALHGVDTPLDEGVHSGLVLRAQPVLGSVGGLLGLFVGHKKTGREREHVFSPLRAGLSPAMWMTPEQQQA